MAEEKREGPPDKDVQEILSDLDAILSDLGGGQPSSAPVSPPKVEALPTKSPASAPFVPPAFKLPPKLAVPAVFSGKPPMELDLEGGAKTGAARPADFIPASIPAPTVPPVRPPQRGLPPADALPDVPMPEKLGKDQVRRVAFIYLGKFEAEREALAKLLDQTAQTVPKKPLFLRRVLYQAITEECEGKDVLAPVLQAKAVAVLGIVEGLSETRLRELGEALAGGGVMFRAVAPLDVGKKSVAIDIVVDVMLLSPEAL